MPVVASQCQSLPASAGHSHSIVNNPLKASTGWGYPVGTSVDTMKNTMFKNSLSAS
jgi:hypothetical protein